MYCEIGNDSQCYPIDNMQFIYTTLTNLHGKVINPFLETKGKVVDLFNKNSTSNNDVEWIIIEKNKQIDIINGLTNLKKNWDSYGAVEISPQVIRIAKNIIWLTPNNIVFNIYPVANGHIQLEIDKDDDYLELEVIDGNKIELYYEKQGRTEEKTFYIHDDGFNALLKMVEKF